MSAEKETVWCPYCATDQALATIKKHEAGGEHQVNVVKHALAREGLALCARVDSDMELVQALAGAGIVAREALGRTEYKRGERIGRRRRAPSRYAVCLASFWPVWLSQLAACAERANGIDGVRNYPERLFKRLVLRALACVQGPEVFTRSVLAADLIVSEEHPGSRERTVAVGAMVELAPCDHPKHPFVFADGRVCCPRFAENWRRFSLSEVTFEAHAHLGKGMSTKVDVATEEAGECFSEYGTLYKWAPYWKDGAR